MDLCTQCTGAGIESPVWWPKDFKFTEFQKPRCGISTFQKGWNFTGNFPGKFPELSRNFTLEISRNFSGWKFPNAIFNRIISSFEPFDPKKTSQIDKPIPSLFVMDGRLPGAGPARSRARTPPKPQVPAHRGRVRQPPHHHCSCCTRLPAGCAAPPHALEEKI